MPPRLAMDPEAGNPAVSDDTAVKVLQGFVATVKPEAACFFVDAGKECAAFVFDMQDSSQIPAPVEPAFQMLQAEMVLTPAMNLDDLQKGLAALAG
jgi:hypothetical protein